MALCFMRSLLLSEINLDYSMSCTNHVCICDPNVRRDFSSSKAKTIGDDRDSRERKNMMIAQGASYSNSLIYMKIS